MNQDPYSRYLLYFERSVLAHYRASPHLYRLEEDDMGGDLQTVHSTGDQAARPYFNVRFGFRRRIDKRVCVAAFGPDIVKLPESDQRIWLGHLIEHPAFAEDDSAFTRWAKRNLEASWEVEDGPRPTIDHSVQLVRAMTVQLLGRPLFRFAENQLVNYPVAENTEAYNKAHLELYRLLVDGLDSEVLSLLAQRLGIVLSDPTKTLNSLKEILPSHLVDGVHKPLRKVSNVRNKSHGVPDTPAVAFPAFDEFHADLLEVSTCLTQLVEWLEAVLSADAEACLKRENVMKSLFPKLSGPPRPEYKLAELKAAEGKTIASVEFGEVASHPDVHESEAIIVHFTDGSSLAIDIGSNVSNLLDDYEGLKPNDVHTDLRVFWAPRTSRP
ncbi:MAG: hypothetical protein IT318_21985 [Anaerolineales bacterium]|nr:hypothetical protein [Anaerolineales bacterium]